MTRLWTLRSRFCVVQMRDPSLTQNDVASASFQTHALRGVGAVDETAFVEFPDDSIIVDFIDFDFTDFGVLQFHQTLDVYHAFHRRERLLFPCAQKNKIDLPRSCLISS